MRITDGMISSDMLSNINRNLGKLDDLQNELSSGNKVNKPSDDPVAVAKILQINRELSENDQYQSNVSDSSSWMEMSESTLGDVGDALHTIRDRVVELSTGSQTPDEKQKILDEIDQLKDHIFQDANTSYVGRYIFSGYQTDKPALILGDLNNVSSEVTGSNVADNSLHVSSKSVSVSLDAGKTINNNDTGDYYIKFSDNSGNFTINKKSSPSDVQIGTGNANGGNIAIAGYDWGLSVPKPSIGSYKTNDTINFTVKSPLKVTGSNIKDPSVKANDTNFSVSAAAGKTLSSSDTGNYYIKVNDTATPPNKFDLYRTDSDKPVASGVSFGSDTGDLNINIGASLSGKFVNGDTVYFSVKSSAVYQGDNGSIDLKFGTATEVSTNVNAGLNGAKLDKLYNMLNDLSDTVHSNGKGPDISSYLTKIDSSMDDVLAQRSVMGAKINRLSALSNELSADKNNLTALLAKVQSADPVQVITDLKQAENVYNASLSVGTRIVEPSLMDFLK